MAEWEIIEVTTSNNVWSKTSAEKIAEAAQGSVKMAYADLGIKAISVHYWYVSIDIDTTATDVPLLTWTDCDYGMLGFAYGGYYPTTLKFGILTLTETATYITSFGGGDGGCSGVMNIYKGDGFAAFKQRKSSLTNSAVFAYDEVTDLATGETVRALLRDSLIFDLDNGISSSNRILYTNIISQSDGTAYTEVTNIMFADKTDGSGSHIYLSKNFYCALIDYDSGRDKTIIINGIKMNKMNAGNLFVPVE